MTDLQTQARTRLTPIQRFVRFTDVRGVDDCWDWKASTAGTGYGCFWDGQRNTHAHRWIFQRFHPVDLTHHEDVCHSCDNPLCVNPQHLFLGDAKINLADCVNKGRHKEASKSRCKHGHPFDNQNTRIGTRLDGRTRRTCLTCERTSGKKYRKRIADELAAIAKGDTP